MMNECSNFLSLSKMRKREGLEGMSWSGSEISLLLTGVKESHDPHEKQGVPGKVVSDTEATSQ